MAKKYIKQWWPTVVSALALVFSLWVHDQAMATVSCVVLVLAVLQGRRNTWL